VVLEGHRLVVWRGVWNSPGEGRIAHNGAGVVVLGDCDRTYNNVNNLVF